MEQIDNYINDSIINESILTFFKNFIDLFRKKSKDNKKEKSENEIKKEEQEVFTKDYLDKEINDKKKKLESKKNSNQQKKEIESQLDKLMSCRYSEGDKEKGDNKDMVDDLKKYIGEDKFKSEFENTKKSAKKYIEKESSKDNNKNDKEEPKEEPKDEIVKSNDGVEWIKRKKLKGEGYTYCKSNDHSVTMSQREWRKHNASKNEGVFSLKNYLNEALESEDSENLGD